MMLMLLQHKIHHDFLNLELLVRDPAGGRQYFVPIDEFSQKLPEVDRHALFTNPKMQGKGWVVPH
jgi:hypothetical protein